MSSQACVDLGSLDLTDNRAAIRGLPPGRHTILVDAETVFGELTGTTIVDVVPSA